MTGDFSIHSRIAIIREPSLQAQGNLIERLTVGLRPFEVLFKGSFNSFQADAVPIADLPERGQVRRLPPPPALQHIAAFMFIGLEPKGPRPLTSAIRRV